VEFLVDGAVIGSVTAAPYETTWDTSTVADGSHSLTARVTDTSNVVATSAPVTVTVSNKPTIDVTASPAETFPKPTSTASGTGQLTFDLVTGAVTGGITVSGITATLAHIHRSIAGTNGPVIVDFVQSAADPNRWDAEAGGQLTAEQIDDLLAGRLYVNVHSAAYPAGEIRGQIKPPHIEIAIADLSGANVVPPVVTTASGIAAATLDARTNTVSVHLNTAGVNDATEAHVHVAPAGANASTPLLTLSKDPVAPAHWSVDGQPAAQADLSALDTGGWYADVHTPANPSGALRAQLSLASTPPPGPPPAPTVTLAQLQETIFTPVCSGCHTGGGSALPASMNLSSAAASFASLVGVASEQRPALSRVASNDPTNSYLVHKIEGGPNIVGSRMPLTGTPLTPEQIANVRAWIQSGAPNASSPPAAPGTPGY
jgi:mono/diheme cytochrome c family protein